MSKHVRLIAHRGNTKGPSGTENRPDYVEKALKEFDVEVDVWVHDGKLWLGHDQPTWGVPDYFVEQAGLWCHAKNISALYALNEMGVQHFFWHEEDKFTLTSSGYIWTYPGQPLTSLSIAVMPELVQDFDCINRGIFGVCSDHVAFFKNKVGNL